MTQDLKFVPPSHHETADFVSCIIQLRCREGGVETACSHSHRVAALVKKLTRVHSSHNFSTMFVLHLGIASNHSNRSSDRFVPRNRIMYQIVSSPCGTVQCTTFRPKHTTSRPPTCGFEPFFYVRTTKKALSAGKLHDAS